MKKILLILSVLVFTQLHAQTPCNNGMAGQYPCNGLDLQSHISLGEMNANSGNDSWGWTDPQDGNEYVLMGLNNGTAFINISDPINPIYLGKLPTHTSSSSWRDIKVYSNYAFIVSEASGHGMQVFDLTRLRNITSPPVTFTEDAHYDGFGNAHNLVINEDSGYAYGVGTNTFNGGPHFVNIQDPLNPVGEGGYSNDFYSHDAQVVTYNGPDTDYSGKEIYIGSNENEVVIVDITDKSSPQGISTISYSNVAYTHQGWFTEDERYFIVGDEIDEINFGFNTRTLIFDLNDLDNPQLHFEYLGPTQATDHNGYVLGQKYYLANYRAGLRIIDISDIAGENFVEEAFFDTYPSNDNASTSSVWNVYPYFGSGNIVISDISSGFFLVKSSAPDTTDPVAVCQNTTVSLDTNGQIIIDPNVVDGGSSDDSGSYSLSVSQNTFTCSDIGPNTITLTITDPSGNTDTCTTTITVEDTSLPIINCLNDATVEYNSGNSFYTLPDYVANDAVQASDNCTENLSILQTPVAGTELTEGVYTINFDTEDNQGNIQNCSFQLTVTEELFVNDISFANSIKIFPVPTSEKVTIISKNQPLEVIEVYDIMGKKIYAENDINSKEKEINVSGFSNGMYFISINKQATKKIIKK